MLNRVLPLGIIETSHFIGSIAGAVLLILSQGLARRLDAAYYATGITLVVGMTASLLKGFDYEEAGLLLVTCTLWAASPPALKGWGQASDPDGDCRFEQKDGKLTISVPGKLHNLVADTGVRVAGRCVPVSDQTIGWCLPCANSIALLA